MSKAYDGSLTFQYNDFHKHTEDEINEELHALVMVGNLLFSLVLNQTYFQPKSWETLTWNHKQIHYSSKFIHDVLTGLHVNVAGQNIVQVKMISTWFDSHFLLTLVIHNPWIINVRQACSRPWGPVRSQRKLIKTEVEIIYKLILTFILTFTVHEPIQFSAFISA